MHAACYATGMRARMAPAIPFYILAEFFGWLGDLISGERVTEAAKPKPNSPSPES